MGSCVLCGIMLHASLNDLVNCRRGVKVRNLSIVFVIGLALTVAIFASTSFLDPLLSICLSNATSRRSASFMKESSSPCLMFVKLCVGTVSSDVRRNDVFAAMVMSSRACLFDLAYTLLPLHGRVQSPVVASWASIPGARAENITRRL